MAKPKQNETQENTVDTKNEVVETPVSTGQETPEVKTPIEKPVENGQVPQEELTEVETPGYISNVEVAPVEVPDSKEKEKFRQLIEIYKVQNPVKYAQKEAELLLKLSKK